MFNTIIVLVGPKALLVLKVPHLAPTQSSTYHLCVHKNNDDVLTLMNGRSAGSVIKLLFRESMVSSSTSKERSLGSQIYPSQSVSYWLV